MKILVANLGSTSFKYRLYDMPAGEQCARGAIDRIGDQSSSCSVEIGGHRHETTTHVADHAAAVAMCLQQLGESHGGSMPPLVDASQLGGIGFKAVFAGEMSGVRRVDEPLLTEMERLATVAPAHNPPYVRAMRQLRSAFPSIPLAAALETGFHETIAEPDRIYACPYEWKERHAVQRWGFHGASHRYIGQRVDELIGQAYRDAPHADGFRVISCHLGGSSSVCGLIDGASRMASMGMTPQTGLPQSGRVGDFDPFALPVVMEQTGRSLDEVLAELASDGGLKGISGLSGDLRDLEEAAAGGHQRAELAIRHFVEQIRHYIGAFMVRLGGCDALVFTGGIGENSRRVRREVCRDLGWAGLFLDVRRNDAVGTDAAEPEVTISLDHSPSQILVIPTNEELVVARQTHELLTAT